jgi:hypothetical protein
MQPGAQTCAALSRLSYCATVRRARSLANRKHVVSDIAASGLALGFRDRSNILPKKARAGSSRPAGAGIAGLLAGGRLGPP